MSLPYIISTKIIKVRRTIKCEFTKLQKTFEKIFLVYNSLTLTTSRLIYILILYHHYITMYQKEHTHGDKNLHTLLVKHYNDLFYGQSSERSTDKVTYFYVGDLFCIHLGTKYANFQENIFAEIYGKKFQTFHYSNVTTIKVKKSLRRFFLKNWHT